LAEVFGEVGGDEDLVFNWLRAVDSEAEGLVFFLFFGDWGGLLHERW
jgi:hypothetical protein